MIDWPRRMNSRRESPNGNARAGIVAVNNWRRVKPAAAAGIKEPAPVMVGRPTPRLKAGKSPAESRIPDPLPIRERRPAIPNAKGPPAKTVSAAIKPGTVRVETPEAGRVVRRICILHGGRGGGRNRVDLSGNPVVEFVGLENMANLHRRR